MSKHLRSSGWWYGVGTPGALTLIILGLDFLEGPKTSFVGLLAVIPMLAAVFARPAVTLGVGTFALSAASLYGYFVASDGQTSAQHFRLAAIALFTLIATLASRGRIKRDAALATAQQVAEAASLAILRPAAKEVGGLKVAVSYNSANKAANVGGDLYEALDTPHGERLVVGDVRGKGLGAVRLATVALGSFREAAHRVDSLTDVAEWVNASVSRETGDEDFVTAVLAQVKDRRLHLVSCGHPAPVLLRDGRCELLETPEGPPWGIPGGYTEKVYELEAGDRVVLYTDGVTEARSKRDRLQFFPLEEEAASALGAGSLEDGLKRLVASIRQFSGNGLDDDAAILVFEVS